MAPPTYSDIFKGTNDLLNKDFYHSTPLAFDVKTVAKNGVQFTLNAKQSVKNAPLSTTLESKLLDKYNGVSLTQGWTNNNTLKSKIEITDLTPGLKTDIITSINPNNVLIDEKKNLNINIDYIQPLFTARGKFNLLNGPPSFNGDLTFAKEGIVAGTELQYNINGGTISKYGLALAYSASDYSIGLSIDNKQFTTLSCNQTLNDTLSIGTKATLNSVINAQKVNLEFATKYILDQTNQAQVKAKINDAGNLAVSYKQLLRPGITLGVGSSFDALNLNEPVHKLGWSLSFNA
ncbi:similar to Saccharomyces cerevisiae YIL114C POR2 Putative mitochondrial porin (voltage-dependent anion channel) [Maudiozyma saulgeensis]|uniref:Similar to Saccharomyces cerevisiae YIL114C POR2 Putative mitochondrial porin (Voltage-dependent anion channel) n=1 Tax=Maudiozyma saulgeensis TaxID=1789683 RepID=A0A1X7QYW7_9SACH|nr:similar to Saccharomyces cerevisiae YIL114C POR2 Putative mitochondrial porin (voltage-dependent anion channel) [Kazachstania saulgeensis]